MKILHLLGLMVFLAGGVEATAQTCPASINVEEKYVAGEAGWEPAQMTHTRSLNSVTLFTGHPSEMMALAPPPPTQSDPTLRIMYDNRDGKPFGENHWVRCSYSGTGVVLYGKVNPAATYCSFRKSPNGPGVGGCGVGTPAQRKKK